MKEIKIKWLVAHEPEFLFVRTAEAFKRALERDGEYKVELTIITKKDFVEQYGNQLGNVMSMIESNEIQMTQTQVSVYGNLYHTDFNVLDMPFLFDNHAHAERVLNGEIGKKLCDELAEYSALTGLAFTYSGGWRIIGSNEPLTGIKDLEKCKIRVNKNPINFHTMRAVGANPIKLIGSIQGYGYDRVESGELDAVESTYLRFEGKSILKTEHSMFLTNVSINTEFLKSFDEETQNAIREATKEAAAIERIESIEDAAKFEAECINDGVTIYDMPEEDRVEFKNRCEAVYARWSTFFGEDLIKAIKES